MTAVVHVGNVLDILPTLEAGSVNCVVTSPPYWGLRDYGTATWEGGSPGCNHRKVQVGHEGLGKSTLGPNRDGVSGQKTNGHQQEGFGTVCGRCGARRTDSQLGLEPTPEEYVANLVAVFREVRRVLRDDGTLWLNLGDSYAAGKCGRDDDDEANLRRRFEAYGTGRPKAGRKGANGKARSAPAGLKPKDLVGIPWRVAFALQQDGWYLRSDIIWAKPNPMPESVTDRPTKAHEYVFLLTKQPRYWYDADAVREELGEWSKKAMESNWNRKTPHSVAISMRHGENFTGNGYGDAINPAGRNRRTVWTIATQPYPEAHFATYPEKLVEPCVLAGCPAQVCGECGAPWERVTETYDTGQRQKMADGWATHDGGHGSFHRDGREQGKPGMPVMGSRTTGFRPTCTHDAPTIPGTVLDPFTGSGTTGAVACRLGRDFVGIELSPEYAEMAERRIAPHRDQMQLAVTT